MDLNNTISSEEVNKDYKYQDLSRKSFRNTDLRGADFRWSDISLADFRGADLRGANLAGAFVHHANFKGANLQGVQGLHRTFGGAQCLN